MTATKPMIDEEFRALLCPLASAEREALEESLRAEGCRDRLVVWQETGILLDGHNRFAICQAHGLPFEFQELSFASREAAADWIDKNQLGRRNLTPEVFRLVLGRRYNRAKRQDGGHGDQKSGDQIDTPNTAERLAAEHGVSPATVKRAAKLAAEVDRLKQEPDAPADPRALVERAKAGVKQARKSRLVQQGPAGADPLVEKPGAEGPAAGKSAAAPANEPRPTEPVAQQDVAKLQVAATAEPTAEKPVAECDPESAGLPAGGTIAEIAERLRGDRAATDREVRRQARRVLYEQWLGAIAEMDRALQIVLVRIPLVMAAQKGRGVGRPQELRWLSRDVPAARWYLGLVANAVRRALKKA